MYARAVTQRRNISVLRKHTKRRCVFYVEVDSKPRPADDDPLCVMLFPRSGSALSAKTLQGILAEPHIAGLFLGKVDTFD